MFPQTLTGLRGILLAPLIHGSFEHLIANTAPCIVLLTVLLYGYPKAARLVLPAVYLGTGICVWLLARTYYHIGASGLTFGFMFFILIMGMLRRDKQAIGLALIVFFLYGGMFGGFVPNDQNISYETHIAGALIGIVLAFLIKKMDPPPPTKKYSWEEEGFIEEEWLEELGGEHDGKEADSDTLH